MTDASGKGIGAVLMQDHHPIAYESRKLKPSELSYSTYDKELLVVVHALKLWKHYLMGSKFLIKTDQQSIRHLLSQPLISDTHIKWASFIQSFHPLIQYQPGHENKVADALSRMPSINNISVISAETFHEMSDTYVHDSDFCEMYAKFDNDHNFVHSEYAFQEGFLFYEKRLCVTLPYRSIVLKECHEPPYIGHRGIATTLHIVESSFYWPSMKKDVVTYVAQCFVCQQVKRHHGKQHGLLMPLPILDAPWQHISMDFITSFPVTKAHNDMIWSIVVRFSKQAYFIPCKKTLSAKQAVELFLKHVFVHHGLPQSIVSDRDGRFCNDFWITLFTNLGTHIDFTSSFHPESNGQIEATNSTILDLLRLYVHNRPGTWDTYIHLLQFAYNNTPHACTTKSPFEIVYGHSLPAPISHVSHQVPEANQLTQTHIQILEERKQAIEKAQQKYIKQAKKKEKTHGV